MFGSILLVFTYYSCVFAAAEAQRAEIPQRQNLAVSRLVSDEAHTRFLIDVLGHAQKSVMISSYDVSNDRLQADGIGRAIIAAERRGVKVYICYEHRPVYSKEEYAQLCRVTNHCARFENLYNHSKCVMEDHTRIAVGSYNWLSDCYKNSRNSSLVLSGELAAEVIEDVWKGIRFYQSVVHENNRGLDNFHRDRAVFKASPRQVAPRQLLYTLITPEAHSEFLTERFSMARQRILMCSPFVRLKKLKETITPQLLRELRDKGVSFQLEAPLNFAIFDQSAMI